MRFPALLSSPTVDTKRIKVHVFEKRNCADALPGNVWIKSKNGLASNFVQTFSAITFPILHISFSLLRFYDIGTGNFVEWIYSSRLHKVWKLIIFVCYFNFHNLHSTNEIRRQIIHNIASRRRTFP